jgi:WD40 repeat protein
VTGHDDGTVRIWRDDQPGDPVETGSEVTALCALEEGGFVTGHEDGTVRVWRWVEPGGDPGRYENLPPL